MIHNFDFVAGCEKRTSVFRFLTKSKFKKFYFVFKLFG
ncbi:hypothetical protein LEP1GSC133_2537 [Leptospira borgpetersenii serovar Pomona str. 200901868]|uniref:Uncharacterized protein n=1 Tax=Leptospira borgpetersenii serovar Pomona str. 200901868 TaxID=1192866 RepID=M6VWM3_LEPBO|nr:hypothetical protein LEP1GSC133_2537 [Leptospira borgpetersenii serovar Pomona str. 200901868]